MYANIKQKEGGLVLRRPSPVPRLSKPISVSGKVVKSELAKFRQK